jgi:hypothetical protein
MPLLGIAGHRVLSLLDEFPFVAMNSPIVGYVGAGVRIPKPSGSGKAQNPDFDAAKPMGSGSAGREVFGTPGGLSVTPGFNSCISRIFL